MNAAGTRCGNRRIPDWLKSGLPDAYSLEAVGSCVSGLGLNSICLEAACPNKRECFSRGEVTFLVLGRNCTRSCGFCNVTAAAPEAVDPREPALVAEAASMMGLEHVVMTSVTRDDLADGGAGHFRACVKALKACGPSPTVEVLVPDFGGDRTAVETVAASGADVFGHNLETVERLCPRVRDRACYSRSLRVLECARRQSGSLVVKSGLMVGLGETVEEVKSAMRDLAGVGCDVVTVGQYMRPSKAHVPVVRYFEPEVFAELDRYAGGLGMVSVCGPRVRSSFGAGPAFRRARLRRQTCA
ncbi:MAG: lipoyl synthase [bacterium]